MTHICRLVARLVQRSDWWVEPNLIMIRAVQIYGQYCPVAHGGVWGRRKRPWVSYRRAPQCWPEQPWPALRPCWRVRWRPEARPPCAAVCSCDASRTLVRLTPDHSPGEVGIPPTSGPPGGEMLVKAFGGSDRRRTSLPATLTARTDGHPIPERKLHSSDFPFS
jgi:hypothetical protein